MHLFVWVSMYLVGIHVLASESLPISERAGKGGGRDACWIKLRATLPTHHCLSPGLVRRRADKI